MKAIIFLILSLSLTMIPAHASETFINLDNSEKINLVNLLSENSTLNKSIPILTGKIKRLATNGVRYCAIDEKSLQCWQWPPYYHHTRNVYDAEKIYTDVKLNNVVDVAISSTQLCAITNSEVNCFERIQSNKSKKITPPITFNKPTKIVATDKMICVVDGTVKCWEDSTSGPTVLASKAIDVTAMNKTICFIYVKGFKCEGELSAYRNEDSYEAGDIAFSELNGTCKVQDKNLFCMKNYYMDLGRSGGGRFDEEILGIKTGVRDRICLQFQKQAVCGVIKYNGIKYYFEVQETHNDKNIDELAIEGCNLKPDNLDCGENNIITRHVSRPSIIPAHSDILNEHEAVSCAVVNEKQYCWNKVDEKAVLMPSKIINPRLLTMKDDSYCTLHTTGINCWKNPNFVQPYPPTTYPKLPTEISFDQSSFLYNEKGLPLKYAQDIINNVDYDFTTVNSLLYMKEVITEKMLTGLNSEAQNTAITNTKVIRNLYKHLGMINANDLTSRSSLHLRFVLSIVANTFDSMKFLLTSESKFAVDRLKLDFANVLAGDEISISQASELIQLVYKESGLLEEMNKSYRLLGISAFYDWTKDYINSGKLE